MLNIDFAYHPKSRSTAKHFSPSNSSIVLGLFGGAVLFWPLSQLSVWAAWWDVKCVFSAFMSSSVRPEPGSFRMGRLSYCSCWLSAHGGGLYHRCRFLSSLALCVASARHTGHRAHCCCGWRAIHTSKSFTKHTHGGCGNTSGVNVIAGPPSDLFIGQHTTVKGLTLDTTETTSRSIRVIFVALDKCIRFLAGPNSWPCQKLGFQTFNFWNSCSAIYDGW